MMKLRRFAILSSVVFLLILTTGAVLAQSSGKTKTVVESDETIRNDIALFGEGLEIQSGATVKGDVALFGGDATIAGTVEGDIVLFGGDLTVENTAVIEGDCALLGGELIGETESALNCTDVAFGANFIPPLMQFAGRLDNSETSVHRPSAGRQFFGGLGETAGQTLVMTILAFGVASLMPKRLVQVAETVRRKPVASGSMGLLTAVSMTIIIAILAVISGVLLFVCIGIMGIPIVFLLAVGLAAGLALGWIALGDLTGRWLADRLNLENRSLPTTAALGTAVLTFGVGLLGALPFMFGEGLITVILVSIGFGAVALTRFGARPYPLSAGYGTIVEASVSEDPDKITAVLKTLPVEESADLKDD